MQPILKYKLEKNLTSKLIDFSLKNELDNFTNNKYGPGRRVCFLKNKDFEFNSECISFAKEIFYDLGFKNLYNDDDLGHFISVQDTGAFTHRHFDKIESNNLMIVRVNFLLQKPIEGGMPIINEKIFNVDEGESWINFATRFYHSTTPVIGDRKRIILSLGFKVDRIDERLVLKKFVVPKQHQLVKQSA